MLKALFLLLSLSACTKNVDSSGAFNNNLTPSGNTGGGGTTTGGDTTPINGTWGSTQIDNTDPSHFVYEYKLCDNPAPSNGGASCSVESGFILVSGSSPLKQRRTLGTCVAGYSLVNNACVASVNGAWGPAQTDNTDPSHFVYEYKLCNNPAPSNGGASCSVESGFTLVSGSSPLKQRRTLGTCVAGYSLVNNACVASVNGTWSSLHIDESKADRFVYEYKLCNSPAPSNGGASCSVESGFTLVSGSSPLKEERKTSNCVNGHMLISGACVEAKASLILGNNNVAPLAEHCPGTYSGGLCDSTWKIPVTFSEEFEDAPQVIVAPEKISNQAGCVNWRTDKVVAFAENITSTGFDLRVSGSPFQQCGAWEGWATYSTAGWIAVGKRKTSDYQKLVAVSAHLLSLGPKALECPNNYYNGWCGTAWKKHITFEKPFKTPPKILVTGENVSTETGGATEAYWFYPENITVNGFDLRGAGSLSRHQNPTYYSAYAVPAQAGYIAIGEVDPAAEATSHLIKNVYTGVFRGGSEGTCSGTFVGGLCSGSWGTNISYPTAFTQIPHVFVTTRNTSNQGGCVGGASDKYVALASNIGMNYFTITAAGSPLTGSCGQPYDNWATYSDLSWLVLGH